jgi:hypothetical protein
MNAYKYVYQNPLRANLCAKITDWKYSTLNGLLGYNKLIIPIEHDQILFPDKLAAENLIWLSKKIDSNNLLAIRKALVKKEFKLARNKQKAHNLEFDLI